MLEVNHGLEHMTLAKSLIVDQNLIAPFLLGTREEEPRHWESEPLLYSTDAIVI